MKPICPRTSPHRLSGTLRAAGLLSCLAAVRIASACDVLPAGQPLSLRLTTPVSSYSSHPGDPITGVLTANLTCTDGTLLALLGSRVSGTVHARHRVGWGLGHETATLDLDFTRILPRSGPAIALRARVANVENARESVRDGVIHGIRSTDTFQGIYNSRLYHLPTWNPFTFPALLLFKTAFPIFPEPEIFFPAGTDLDLRTTAPVAAPPPVASLALASLSLPAPAPASDIDAEALVDTLPWRVTTGKNADADIVNLVLVGSESLVREAFTAAAWNTADPLSRRAVLKNLYALLNNSGYTREPMTTFFVGGSPQDMSWQRSLNSYNRRDHLRLWRAPSSDPTATPVWIGSSTEDLSAVLAVRQHGFVHHIAPDLDHERAIVLRDLSFAGCVASTRLVARSAVPNLTRNSTGDLMRTDGAVAVVHLQPCRNASSADSLPSIRAAAFRPGNLAFRFVRRQLLTLRSDLFRANPIYGAWDISHHAILALRRPAPGATPDQPATTPVPAAPLHAPGLPTFRLTAAPQLPPAILTLAISTPPAPPEPTLD